MLQPFLENHVSLLQHKIFNLLKLVDLIILIKSTRLVSNCVHTVEQSMKTMMKVKLQRIFTLVYTNRTSTKASFQNLEKWAAYTAKSHLTQFMQAHLRTTAKPVGIMTDQPTQKHLNLVKHNFKSFYLHTAHFKIRI